MSAGSRNGSPPAARATRTAIAPSAAEADHISHGRERRSVVDAVGVVGRAPAGGAGRGTGARPSARRLAFVHHDPGSITRRGRVPGVPGVRLRHRYAPGVRSGRPPPGSLEAPVADRAAGGVARSRTDRGGASPSDRARRAAAAPVVLDEPNRRREFGELVADVPVEQAGDHEHRRPDPEAERVDLRWRDVVVEAAVIVPREEDGGVCPHRTFHDRVEHLRGPGLAQQKLYSGWSETSKRGVTHVTAGRRSSRMCRTHRPPGSRLRPPFRVPAHV